MEQFANNPSSTLTTAINSSVTSIVVASATTFSQLGNFRIVVDNELMMVTAVSGTTFTVIRAIEGTTAASHLAQAAVIQILTAGGLLAGIVDPTQSVLNGTTAGTATSSQPVQAPTYKKFICFLNGYENDSSTAQTITFPTAFQQPPIFIANVDPECSTTTTTLTLPSNMSPSGSVTGWIILEGY